MATTARMVMTVLAAQAALAAACAGELTNAPLDVSSFVVRRMVCNDRRDYKKDDAINTQTALDCETIAKDEAELRKKYQSDHDVISILNAEFILKPLRKQNSP